jgi:hypothetical protein
MKCVQASDASYSRVHKSLKPRYTIRWDEWAERLLERGIRFEDRRDILWGASSEENPGYHSDDYDPSDSDEDETHIDEADKQNADSF